MDAIMQHPTALCSQPDMLAWLRAQLNMAIMGVYNVMVALEDPFNSQGLDSIFVDEGLMEARQVSLQLQALPSCHYPFSLPSSPFLFSLSSPPLEAWSPCCRACPADSPVACSLETCAVLRLLYAVPVFPYCMQPYLLPATNKTGLQNIKPGHLRTPAHGPGHVHICCRGSAGHSVTSVRTDMKWWGRCGQAIWAGRDASGAPETEGDDDSDGDESPTGGDTHGDVVMAVDGLPLPPDSRMGAQGMHLDSQRVTQMCGICAVWPCV